METDIRFENGAVIVCVKPAGVLSQDGPGAAMPALLRAHTGGEIYAVHRLDTAAAGLMVFAKTKAAAAALSAQIAAGQFEKEYLCVIRGRPENDAGVYEDLLFRDAAKNKSYVVSRQRRGVKAASLAYTLAETAGETSLVRVRLFTGRTHQIRIQFASRGTPLVGDGKYGARDNAPALALFSCGIGFTDPETGKRMLFSADPPDAPPWNAFGAAK